MKRTILLGLIGLVVTLNCSCHQTEANCGCSSDIVDIQSSTDVADVRDIGVDTWWTEDYTVPCQAGSTSCDGHMIQVKCINGQWMCKFCDLGMECKDWAGKCVEVTSHEDDYDIKDG